MHPDDGDLGGGAGAAGARWRCRARGWSDAGEVRELEPELTGELHGASLFPDDLQCDPRAIARALAREAGQAGATIREGCAVDAIVIAGRDVDDASRLVAGARAASPAPARSSSPPDRGARRSPRAPGSCSRSSRARASSCSSPPPSPAWSATRSSTPPTSPPSRARAAASSSRPSSRRRGRATSSSARRASGAASTPRVDPAVSDALVARAARLFPRLAQLPVAAAWAGLRPWLPDGLPAIGPSRSVPGLWLATGHEGAGVALGPVTGRLVAQLYTGEEPVVDPAPFDPDRFSRREAALAADRARRRHARRRSRRDPGP